MNRTEISPQFALPQPFGALVCDLHEIYRKLVSTVLACFFQLSLTFGESEKKAFKKRAILAYFPAEKKSAQRA